MNLGIPNFVGPITKNRTESRGGGVAFYINNKLDFEVIQNMSLTEKAEKAIESLTIKINHKSKSHILVCIYRPPKQNLTNLFYERLEHIIQMKNAEFPNSILEIIGDFNINTLDPITRIKFYEQSMSHGLLPLVTKPTRITTSTKSLIDNILSSHPQNTGTYVIRTNISDHFPVLLSRNVNRKEKTSKTKYIRLVNSKNISSFKENLTKVKWDKIYEIN